MRSIIVAALIGLGASQAAAEDDPYLWLEDRTGAPALEWVKAENARARGAITADPRFGGLYAKSLKLHEADDIIPYAYPMGDFVYNFWQDAKNPLGLLRRATLQSYKTERPEWEAVVDFDALSAAEGVNWVYGHIDCLHPDYRTCVISMSPDGGDASVVREFDLETKAFMADGFNLPVSKSGVTLVDRDTALVSSTFGPGEETASGYPRVVKRWKRGEPFEAAVTLYEAEADDMAAGAYAIDDMAAGQRHLLVNRQIDFYTAELLYLRPDDSLASVPMPPDAEKWVLFDGQLLFSPQSDWQAPDGSTLAAGGVHAFDFRFWTETGEAGLYTTLVEPAERVSIESFWPNANRLFVSMTENVEGKVVAFRHGPQGWGEPQALALPANGTISIDHADYHGSSVSFTFSGLITPPTLYWSDDDGDTLEPIKSLPARFDSAQFVAERFEATSKDGTRIPYFVARPKDLSGPVPTLLYAYGGFQSSMLPWYSGLRGQLWLEQGNAWVLANIRGGGEFGPAWHRAALKEKRQTAFDDFAAVAGDLVTRGLTTARQLGIQGGSNGGLLVGVSITQRPELFGAAISEVPLLDMMRYTLLPPGASWIAEYGDPTKPEEAAFIRAYSPYQNVEAGKAYPKTLFMTSTADDRVHPGHARKMAARMLEQGHDVLFHEYLEGGHGGSGDIRRQAEWAALEYMFLQQTLEGGGIAQTADAADRTMPAGIAAIPSGVGAADRCAAADVRDVVPAAGPRSASLAAREAVARQICE